MVSGCLLPEFSLSRTVQSCVLSLRVSKTDFTVMMDDEALVAQAISH